MNESNKMYTFIHTLHNETHKHTKKNTTINKQKITKTKTQKKNKQRTKGDSSRGFEQAKRGAADGFAHLVLHSGS